MPSALSRLEVGYGGVLLPKNNARPNPGVDGLKAALFPTCGCSRRLNWSFPRDETVEVGPGSTRESCGLIRNPCAANRGAFGRLGDRDRSLTMFGLVTDPSDTHFAKEGGAHAVLDRH
jgi:hypothetical protein